MGNAVKFGRKNTIPEVIIRSSKRNGRAIVEFIDNSEGIDMSQYEDKIFQPFIRLQPTDSGSGIGLYIVKRQIESMNGTIELESEKGKGCRFIMSFLVPPEKK